jgi:hypothetical protein
MSTAISKNNPNGYAIKIIKLVTGEEIIATVVSDKYPHILTVQFPVSIRIQLISDSETSISYMKWIPYTSDTLVEINIHSVICAANVDAEMESQYYQALKHEQEFIAAKLNSQEKAKQDYENIQTDELPPESNPDETVIIPVKVIKAKKGSKKIATDTKGPWVN